MAEPASADRRSDGAPAAVSWGTGRIDLFWRAPDGRLAHRAFDGDRWSAVEGLGGTLASAPAVTAWAVDQMEVFAVFPDGELWNRYWDGESWHPWESLGGELDPADGCAASSWGPSRLDVFAARPRWPDLASLVGRLTLGRLGATRGRPVSRS